MVTVRVMDIREFKGPGDYSPESRSCKLESMCLFVTHDDILECDGPRSLMNFPSRAQGKRYQTMEGLAGHRANDSAHRMA